MQFGNPHFRRTWFPATAAASAARWQRFFNGDGHALSWQTSRDAEEARVWRPVRVLLNQLYLSIAFSGQRTERNGMMGNNSFLFLLYHRFLDFGLCFLCCAPPPRLLRRCSDWASSNASRTSSTKSESGSASSARSRYFSALRRLP